jgi:hypothetical protein
LPSEAATQAAKSLPVSIGPARSMSPRITSDLGILRRRAHWLSREARSLSSLTVMVGIVIPRYYTPRPGQRQRSIFSDDTLSGGFFVPALRAPSIGDTASRLGHQTGMARAEGCGGSNPPDAMLD